ncbi:tripartite motif-containing protein 3-like [Saccostrea cucullata]|uniref:tripartite motif-containing protein 3-like n=1 Tax=Saccostrea cuccullata TaxID=36930 RepID=UPI002ED69EFF
MQAQVLSAVVYRVTRTINYGHKYVVDVKYAGNGGVCVSVVNSKGTRNINPQDSSIRHFFFGESCLPFMDESTERFILLDKESLFYRYIHEEYKMQFERTKIIFGMKSNVSKEYSPTRIALCNDNAILICLWNHQVNERSMGKVIKISFRGETFFELETQKNKPLFTCPNYIAENGNEDICVSDVNAVVVTDAGGLLRFRYKGLSDDPQFDPYGICCDSQNNIIIADMMKNRIHMIDENGEFLHYIQYKDMNKPRALCIDEDDNLYVGEWSSEEIKVLSRQ